MRGGGGAPDSAGHGSHCLCGRQAPRSSSCASCGSRGRRGVGPGPEAGRPGQERQPLRRCPFPWRGLLLCSSEGQPAPPAHRRLAAGSSPSLPRTLAGPAAHALSRPACLCRGRHGFQQPSTGRGHLLGRGLLRPAGHRAVSQGVPGGGIRGMHTAGYCRVQGGMLAPLPGASWPQPASAPALQPTLTTHFAPCGCWAAGGCTLTPSLAGWTGHTMWRRWRREGGPSPT